MSKLQDDAYTDLKGYMNIIYYTRLVKKIKNSIKPAKSCLFGLKG